MANCVGHDTGGATLDENDSLNDNVEDFDTSGDLVSDNTIMNVACYGDGQDSTAVEIDDWTTGSDNYIRIYTPTASSEVGITQRHSGVWDDNKYNLVVATAPIQAKEENLRFEGLQLKVTQVLSNGTAGIVFYNTSAAVADYRVSSCIIEGISQDSYSHHGINVGDSGTSGRGQCV